MSKFNGNNITNKDFNIVYTELSCNSLLTMSPIAAKQAIIISSANETVGSYTYNRITLLASDTNGMVHVLAYDANMTKDKIDKLKSIAYICAYKIAYLTGEEIDIEPVDN